MLRQGRDRGVGGKADRTCRNLFPRNSRGGVGGESVVGWTGGERWAVKEG